MGSVQPETAQSRAADALAALGIAAVKQQRFAEGLAMLEQAARDYEDCLLAQRALCEIRFPGLDYLKALGQIHAALRPRTYLEIGVAAGASMARALPTTRCIGVDPALTPEVRLGPNVEAHVMTSNEFFAKNNVTSLLGGLPVDLGFIDGLHLFEAAFDDFANLERYCTPGSTIILHDCLPLFPVAAERERRTRFWTGDVWRLLPTLARFRPDLVITMIEANPSGLAIVRGLNPTSAELGQRRDEALAFGFGLPFETTKDPAALGIRSVPSRCDEISQILA